MSSAEPQPASVRHYYVDEAGDPTLFDRKGRIIVGTEGCSRFFILGLLHTGDPDALEKDLTELRAALLKDPYFKKVPSMRPEAKKTAFAFHAKDDVAEVRREVFAVLRRHPLRFFAEVREKRKLVDFVLQWNEQSTTYRYRSNDLYDQLVSRLFKNQLHKADRLVIQFARRGASDRTAALRSAIVKAQHRFEKQWGITCNALVEISAGVPAQSAGCRRRTTCCGRCNGSTSVARKGTWN